MSPAQSAKINNQIKVAQSIISSLPSKASDRRVTTAVAKRVMLNGKVFTRGNQFEPKIKSLGVGVYNVWFEEVF